MDHQYFYEPCNVTNCNVTNCNVTNLLFKGWTITCISTFVLTCLLFLMASVVLEVLSSLGVYLTRCYATNPLKIKWTSSTNTRSPLLAPLQIPSSVSKVRQRRCKIHLGRTMVHTLYVFISYLLMLAVMTYIVYFLVAVALGSALGYFMFAPFRQPPVKKAPGVNRRAQRDEMIRSRQMDTGGDEVIHTGWDEETRSGQMDAGDRDDTPNVKFYGFSKRD